LPEAKKPNDLQKQTGIQAEKEKPYIWTFSNCGRIPALCFRQNTCGHFIFFVWMKEKGGSPFGLPCSNWPLCDGA
jgi:hypothetical protein